MSHRTFVLIIVAVSIFAFATYVVIVPTVDDIPLVGMIEGNEVVVSPQISGRIVSLNVDEGTAVKKGDLIARLDQRELIASLAAAKANVASLSAQVDIAKHNFALTDEQTDASFGQARATLTSILAQLERARVGLSRDEKDYKRIQYLFESGVSSLQDRDHAETMVKISEQDVAALENTVMAQNAALTVAQSNRKQVDVRKSELAMTLAQLEQARASELGVETQLDYTKVYAPVDGIVSLRVASKGEFVSQGSTIVVVIDVDHLWVRADVEESYIDSIQFGQTLCVRLPSGETLRGQVFFKGVEGDFATQRDVSLTKRDIRTFAVKVSVPKVAKNLFTGMTATVLLPRPEHEGRFEWMGFRNNLTPQSTQK